MTGLIKLLKDELTIDPLNENYASMSNLEVVASINALTRTEVVPIITGSQLGEAVDKDEYNNLTSDTKKLMLLELKNVPTLKTEGFVVTVIKDIFPSNGPTVAALVALKNKPISRGSEIKLPKLVKEGHVEMARPIDLTNSVISVLTNDSPNDGTTSNIVQLTVRDKGGRLQVEKPVYIFISALGTAEVVKNHPDVKDATKQKYMTDSLGNITIDIVNSMIGQVTIGLSTTENFNEDIGTITINFTQSV